MSEPQETHLLRLDGDFSDASGVVSTPGTLAWPANSPPDAGLPVVCGDNIGDVSYGEVAEPFNGANMANMQYSPETYGFSSPRGETFDFSTQRPFEHSFSNSHQHEESFQGTNDGTYNLLDHTVENPASYLHTGMESYNDCEVWNCFQEVSPHLTGEALSSSNEENSMHNYCDGSASCRHEDPLTEYAGITHPQSGAIKIEGVSERFQSDLASSFPPTTRFFSEYWPDRVSDVSRNVDEPPSRSIALRPASRNSRVNRKPSISATMPTLSVIHEDGKGGVALSTLNTMKGRRVGPLSKSKAAQAAKNRKEKCVCIRCKMMKQSVSCAGCGRSFQVCNLTVLFHSVQEKYLAEAARKI